MPTGSATQTPLPSFTYTITDTPTITPTAVIPAVADKNVFKPDKGDSVTFSFKASEAGRVRVHVYNLAAELVRSPFDADVMPGAWIQAVWDGRNGSGELVGSGVYVVSVRGAGIRAVMKVVIVK